MAMLKMNSAYILAGSNMGNRLDNLQRATKKLIELGEIKRKSSLYETAAWGNENQQAFFNVAFELTTHLSGVELMKALLLIESESGRIRNEKWEPRLIDLDILFFNAEIIDTSILQVPHPQFQFRKFAIIPMADLAVDFIHPVLKKTVLQLLEECTDKLQVEKIDEI